MELNSIFFPAPKTTQNIQDFKDQIIWIPRRVFYETDNNSPKHILNKKQFVKRLGQQEKSTFKIAQPQMQEDEEYNPYSFLTTQEEDELIELDEQIPLRINDKISSPCHLNNYITKNFIDCNSFQTKSPSSYDYSSRYSSPRLSNDQQSTKSKWFSKKQQNQNEKYTYRSFAEYEYDIQSEQYFKNRQVNEQPDEIEFYSQPVSQFNKPQSLRNNLKHILEINKCQSAGCSPSNKQEINRNTHILASLLKSPLEGTQYIMIYFHSNGEDIVTCYELVNHLRKTLNIHIVTVEYPGYTYYKGQASAEQIEKDALDTYYYFNQIMKIPENKIIVLGRSIGTGPATFLASQHKLACLALLSPFTSLRDLVKDKVGSLIQYLVQERFNNLENIKKVKCPTFICHGQKDSLIQISHSQTLHNNCPQICELILPKDMKHNQLDYYQDLTFPLGNFLTKNKIKIFETNNKNPLVFPEYLFQNPNQTSQSYF
ncbi:hypothetical protein ABPG74_014693 [Tetrahymena malaccensis]